MSILLRDFQKASNKLKIEVYPSDIDLFFQNEYEGSFDPSDLSVIENLQETEDIFGEYFEIVKQAAKELKNDASALLWAKVISEYICKSSCETARAVKIPESDGSVLRDMLPLLIMIPSMTCMRPLLTKRGFDGGRISEYMEIFKKCIAATERKIGRPAHDYHYFKWTMLYVKGMIFTVGGFRFELKRHPKNVLYLENLGSGELVPIMINKTIHRSGAVLGSAGFEDEEGCFFADFEENDGYFKGYCVQNTLVSSEPRVFSKKKWKIFVSPGDNVMSIHIPKGTDISEKAFYSAVHEARCFISEYYSEYDPKCLCCHSWLLDPALSKILGDDAKIVKFGERFVRYPVKSAGKDVFSFVFPPQITDLNDLPENTRLERGLKKLYLDGGYIYSFAGIFRFID